jgi:hypothetical protein
MEDYNETEGLLVQPESPSITPKPGWQTSQGQMTAIFTLICVVLAALGFHYTPEQLNGWADTANSLAKTIGPIVVAMISLYGYTTSRGKITSNAIIGTAHVQAAAMQAPQLGTAIGTPVEFAGGLGNLKHVIGSAVGGHDWKDPERYGNLLKIAGAFGVPGATQADKINQQVHADELVKGLIDAIHSGKKLQF